MTKQKGFTLIELLVVIAIIGLLASIVMVSLNSARGKARVAKAMTELKQLRTAIYMYYNDASASPPHDHTWDDTCENDMFASRSSSFAPKPSGWAGPYMPKWPNNPWGYAYHWERNRDGSGRYSISIQDVTASEAAELDTKMDNGIAGSGIITYSGSPARVEFWGFDDFVSKDTHTTSCP